MGREGCWAGFVSVLCFRAAILVFSGVVGTRVVRPNLALERSQSRYWQVPDVKEPLAGGSIRVHCDG